MLHGKREEKKNQHNGDTNIQPRVRTKVGRAHCSDNPMLRLTTNIARRHRCEHTHQRTHREILPSVSSIPLFTIIPVITIIAGSIDLGAAIHKRDVSLELQYIELYKFIRAIYPN